MSGTEAPLLLGGLRVAVAQVRSVTGDLDGNRDQILAAAKVAHAAGADLLVTSALALPGPDCEGLLADEEFLAAAETRLAELAAVVPLPVAVGSVVAAHGPLVPAALVSSGHRGDRTRPAAWATALLVPGGGVQLNLARTPMSRHLVAGATRQPMLEVPAAEDRMVPVACVGARDLVRAAADETADWVVACDARLVLAQAADFFHVGRPAEREAAVSGFVDATGVPVLYANTVGGAGERVYDGRSFAVLTDGRRAAAGSFLEPSTVLATDVPPAPADPVEETYRVLVAGFAAAVSAAGFGEVLLGLSGGIDSALVATIAVDALGADRVHGVSMPGPFSSDGSRTDAADLAARLGITLETVDIAGGYAERMSALDGLLTGPGGVPLPGAQVAGENLQARLRGVTLMTLANARGELVVSTGNKSEVAMGYFTLYGDACGTAPNPIADVYKTTVTYPDGTMLPGVYELARWRNTHPLVLWSPVAPIPEATLVKAPSAELAPGQADADTLPEYTLLDPLLLAYLEVGVPTSRLVEDLTAAGMSAPDAAALVRRVLRQVAGAEFKRRQAPPRLRVSRVAFGADRVMPAASGWDPADGLG